MLEVRQQCGTRRFGFGAVRSDAGIYRVQRPFGCQLATLERAHWCAEADNELWFNGDLVFLAAAVVHRGVPYHSWGYQLVIWRRHC